MSRGSRLRYLLATSKATLALVPLLVAFGYSVLPRITTWRGDAWWGYNHLVQALPIAIVLVAFVAGWDAGAPGSGYRSLRDRAPVAGWRVPATLLAAPVAAGALPYLAGLLLVVAATVGSHGRIEPVAGLVVATHLAMLALAAAVGVFVGRFVSSPYAAAGAAAIMAGLLFWSPPGARTLFAFPGTGGPAVDGTPDLGMYGVAPIGLVLATAALAAPALSLTARRGPVVGAALGAAATLWVASTVVSPDMYLVSQDRPSRCRTESVTICVYPGYDRLLRPAGKALEATLARADRNGVPRHLFPARYEQGGNVRTRAGVAEIYVGEDEARTRLLAADSIAQSVSSPDWCPEMFADEPPLALLERVGLVHDWVLRNEDALSPPALIERHPEQQGRSPDDVAADVRTALAEIRTCTNT